MDPGGALKEQKRVTLHQNKPDMCQLLGMNCATPTDITFSFTGFAARGGDTDHHSDGFGIAFYEDRSARCFIDNTASCQSPIAELIKQYPIKSRNVIAHIRKATHGAARLENCHPFIRERWGRHWLFAHNGDLHDFNPGLDGIYSPVGQTDSERAFCVLMEQLYARFGTYEPDNGQLFSAVADITAELTCHGIYNFLLSNGKCLIAHCSTRLYHITRAWPFQSANLIDADLSVDFADVTTPDDCVSVIATQPLTDNETWTAFQTGELVMFVDGRVHTSCIVPIPEDVQHRNRENASCL